MPEHGTWARYQRGCRQACCTDAARNYQKARVIDAHRGKPRTVPSLGTRRRIEALACLGWSGYDVASRLGHGREWIRQVVLCDRIHRRTADRIAAVYEELCMTLPPTETHIQRAMVNRTKNRAARHGYAPPLAWDDPDTDDAPRGIRTTNRRDLLTEWAELEAAGESIDQAALRLGVKPGAIERAVFRAKAVAS